MLILILPCSAFRVHTYILTLVCRHLDGKTFPLSQRVQGTNYPPMHPWCRSTTIAELDKEILHNLKRRATLPDGTVMTVPADMTYKEWYGKYVAKENDSGKLPKIEKESILTPSIIEVLKDEFGDLNNKKIVLFSERLKHIKDRHGETSDVLKDNFDSIISKPDYILKDRKNNDTVWFIKNVTDKNINVVIKLSVKGKTDDKFLNSVITSYELSVKQLNRYLNKNKHLK